MGRTFSPGNPELAVLSGPIGPAVQAHALERMRRFFFYCSSLKVTCDYVARVHNIVLRPQDAIMLKATHQVDRGTRNDQPKLGTAVGLNANVDAQPKATGHGSMDAAHFNNLGLRDHFTHALDRLAINDPGVRKLLAYCIASCEDTRPLPQAVNLGPDKVIDSVHCALINVVFSMGAANTQQVVTSHLACQYINMAIQGLTAYQARKRPTNPGLADLAEFYKRGVAAQQNVIVKGAWDGVYYLCADMNELLNQLTPKRTPLRANDYVEG